MHIVTIDLILDAITSRAGKHVFNHWQFISSKFKLALLRLKSDFFFNPTFSIEFHKEQIRHFFDPDTSMLLRVSLVILALSVVAVAHNVDDVVPEVMA